MLNKIIQQLLCPKHVLTHGDVLRPSWIYVAACMKNNWYNISLVNNIPVFKYAVKP